MNLYTFLGGIALAVAIFMAGAMTGGKFKQVEWDQDKAARNDRALVMVKKEVVEVPKIVTKVVTKEVTVEKEVERVVTQVPHLLAPDCVLPDDFGMLLVAAANGIDPTTGDVDALTGKYGCRETLAAVLADLSAGWKNSARLAGLQEYTRLVAPTTTKGETP